jgi:phage terminase large subunit-like protein
MSETYREIVEILDPLVVSASKIDGLIRLRHGGRVDFWTLNNPRAGRSRKYHSVLIDEAAFAGPDMMDIWQQAIRPSLLDYQGSAWVFSTPSGKDDDNFFYRICTDPSHGFVDIHAPTSGNPYLPAQEIARLEADNTPLVYSQEYLAEFVDWSGVSFFAETSLLDNGVPVDYPGRTDQVYAVVDTALKDGLEHDGTAVTYFCRNKIAGHPLIILDWEVLQITGDLLDAWLPTVIKRCEELAQQCGSRGGVAGVWVEDKSSGTVLIQQAQRKQMPVYGIDGVLTAMGKDGRALSVSSYVHQGMVKISGYAHNKITAYRGISKNHFLGQVCGYRVGAKTPHSMDLLDTFCYGVAIGLGDSFGY